MSIINPIIKEDKTFFGHPIKMSYLFFINILQSFSFYGLSYIVVLYISSLIQENETLNSTNIYYLLYFGTYLFAVIGGLIGDRLIGAKNSLIIGSLIIIIGWMLFFGFSASLFYFAFIPILIGTALIKPNLLKLVGDLYSFDDVRRDFGFLITYLSTCLGAVFGFFIVILLTQYNIIFGIISIIIATIIQLYLTVVGVDNTKINKPNIKTKKINWEFLTILVTLSSLFFIFYSSVSLTTALSNTIIKNANTSYILTYLAQILSPLFVVGIIPIITMIWLFLEKKQPSNFKKVILGIFSIGISFLISSLIFISTIDVKVSDIHIDNIGEISLLWIILICIFSNISSILIIPTSFSIISKYSKNNLTAFWIAIFQSIVPFSLYFYSSFSIKILETSIFTSFSLIGVTLLLLSGVLFKLTSFKKFKEF